MHLLDQMKYHYGINFDKLDLIRDWIGQVYEVSNGSNRYITKVFRKEYTKEALQSVEVMAYLRKNEFPVPDIIKTIDGNRYFIYNDQMVVLYEYIVGEEVDKASKLIKVGQQSGWMRRLMDTYTEEISYHDYDFFIQRYLNIMKINEYQGIDKFSELGNYLWEQVKNLPSGFIHGDLHTGNMLQNQEIIFFDFDACSISSPVYDIATFCDTTNYFDLSEDNFDYGFVQTHKNVIEFLKGYENFFHLSKEEEKAIYYFIAIRHFDIQATIIESRGLACVNERFLDEQYAWLEKWLDRISS